jgi:hypothetical protein
MRWAMNGLDVWLEVHYYLHPQGILQNIAVGVYSIMILVRLHHQVKREEQSQT